MTHFAPAARASKRDLEAHIAFAANNPVINGVLGCAGGLIAVLNSKRQIVALNYTFLETLGIDNPSEVLGFRPGEAISCIHSDVEEGGCGTARPCSTCGAAVSIVTALASGEPVERECVATVRRGDSTEDLVLKVRAVMLSETLDKFVLLFLHDITKEQARAALDRVFFHDLANILSSLVSAASLLELSKHEMDTQLQQIIVTQVKRLNKEVEMQRLVSTHGVPSLSAEIAPVPFTTIREDLELIIARHKSAREKDLELWGNVPFESVSTDRYVLSRILTNMVINAMEATEPGGKVTVEVKDERECLEFRVWNDAYIPPEIQPRVFQRNFSTKGTEGRGLGTYSMKIFAERYLNGAVSFSTSPTDGTIFYLHLPLKTE